MSGWCLANLAPLSPRQRLFCMIATSIPDVDGLTLLGGQDAYLKYHHTFGHNLAFGILGSGVLAVFSRRQFLLSFLIYLAMFHLHLFLDYFGSGPGWGIPYFWPVSLRDYVSPHAWEFYSWQNITIAAVLFAWTIGIARYWRRTPLETIMPNLDRQLVDIIGKRFEARPRNQ